MYDLKRCAVYEIYKCVEGAPTLKELGGRWGGIYSGAQSSVGRTGPAEYAPRQISLALFKTLNCWSTLLDLIFR